MNENISYLKHNQKLQDIWSKCKHPHPIYGGCDMSWPMEFAELIVKECINIANNVHMCRDGRPVAEDIKKHFGVEE